MSVDALMGSGTRFSEGACGSEGVYLSGGARVEVCQDDIAEVANGEIACDATNSHPGELGEIGSSDLRLSCSYIAYMRIFSYGFHISNISYVASIYKI